MSQELIVRQAYRAKVIIRESPSTASGIDAKPAKKEPVTGFRTTPRPETHGVMPIISVTH